MRFDLARERAVNLRDFARFTGDAVAEYRGPHAARFEKFRGGLQRLLCACNDAVLSAGEYFITGLRCFGEFALDSALERCAHRSRNFALITREYAERVLI